MPKYGRGQHRAGDTAAPPCPPRVSSPPRARPAASIPAAPVPPVSIPPASHPRAAPRPPHPRPSRSHPSHPCRRPVPSLPPPVLTPHPPPWDGGGHREGLRDVRPPWGAALGRGVGVPPAQPPRCHRPTSPRPTRPPHAGQPRCRGGNGGAPRCSPGCGGALQAVGLHPVSLRPPQKDPHSGAALLHQEPHSCTAGTGGVGGHGGRRAPPLRAGHPHTALRTPHSEHPMLRTVPRVLPAPGPPSTVGALRDGDTAGMATVRPTRHPRHRSAPGHSIQTTAGGGGGGLCAGTPPAPWSTLTQRSSPARAAAARGHGAAQGRLQRKVPMQCQRGCSTRSRRSVGYLQHEVTVQRKDGCSVRLLCNVRTAAA